MTAKDHSEDEAPEWNPELETDKYWEDQTDNAILTLILTAAENGETEDLKLLLEALNDKSVLGLPDANGDSALALASLFGHQGCVELLISAGADVKIRDKDGNGTPLHHAAAGGYLGICQLLIEHGAEVNAKDDDGETALHTAARGGHMEVVKFLLEKGADVTLRSSDFKSAADEAGDDAPEVRDLLRAEEEAQEALKEKN